MKQDINNSNQTLATVIFCLIYEDWQKRTSGTDSDIHCQSRGSNKMRFFTKLLNCQYSRKYKAYFERCLTIWLVIAISFFISKHIFKVSTFFTSFENCFQKILLWINIQISQFVDKYDYCIFHLSHIYNANQISSSCISIITIFHELHFLVNGI